MTKEAKLERIIRAIAKRHHTTPEQVCMELKAIIDSGWANPDPVIHARWLMIGRGKKPSVQELIFFSADVIKMF